MILGGIPVFSSATWQRGNLHENHVSPRLLPSAPTPITVLLWISLLPGPSIIELALIGGVFNACLITTYYSSPIGSSCTV